MKTCSKCGLEQPLENFHIKLQVKSDGRASVCKSCRASDHAAVVRARSRAATNTLTHRMRKYGLTREQAAEAAKIQHCQATGAPLTTGRGMDSSCVDHSHALGHVRGVVSKRVNMILGYAEDDVHVLEQCIAYLHRTEDPNFDWAADYETWSLDRDLG